MDPARPLISVVIPCYNQARFLPEAVESVASCRYPTQIVVVDDGCTDDAAAVAERLPGVTLIQQENRGLAAARNRGLAAAIGDFVVFLDADDRMLPGGLDTAATALSAHPDCALVYGRCQMMGVDGELWPTPDQPVVLTDHYGAMLRSNRIWMPAMAMFRREALERAGGFRSGFDAVADYDLYLRIAREHPVHDHGTVVAAYRRHADSMSRNAARMLRETLTVLRRHRAPAAASGRMDAWREGRAMFQGFYGTHLVEEIRAHVRAREIWPAIRKAVVLLLFAPRIFAREFGRKIRAGYAGRAIPAAEMPAAKTRAES